VGRLRRSGIQSFGGRAGTVLLWGVALFIACRVGVESGRAQAPVPMQPPFLPSGDLSLREDFRHWEHVGTRVKTSGRSVLDGSTIVTPQMMDTYIEPSAYAAFRETGKWPDGTMIAKELSLIKTGPNCDKTNFACSTPAGAGIFEDHFIGVGMMVKDSTRFPNAPGNWAYFRFLLAGTQYPRSAKVLTADQCQDCHARFAANQDYVFTNTHIGLISADGH
jgi:hypothetical protein